MASGVHPKDKDGNYFCPGRVPEEILRDEWAKKYKVHPSDIENLENLETLERIERQRKENGDIKKEISIDEPILKSELLTKDNSQLNDIALGRGRVLVRDANSFEVLKVQEALNNFGFTLKPSGVFCLETEDVFNDFQRSHVPTHSVHLSYVITDNCIVDSNALLRIDEALIEGWQKPILQSELFKNSKNLNKLAKGKFSPIEINSKDRGEIMIIQQALIEFGFNLGAADGLFGEKTELAVMDFQREFEPTYELHSEYGLKEPDGIVGSQTLFALDEAIESLWIYVSQTKKVVMYLTRKWQTSESTIGEYTIEGTTIKGYMLEEKGPDTTISGLEQRVPIGTYNLEWHNGSRFKGVLKLFNSNVSKSRAILIHKGNTAEDTEGCLLPGKTKSKNFVGNSVAAFNEIINHVKNVGIDGALIIINEDYNNDK